MNNLNNLENSNKTKNCCYTFLAVLIIALIWIAAVLSTGVLLAWILKDQPILTCIASVFGIIVVWKSYRV